MKVTDAIAEQGVYQIPQEPNMAQASRHRSYGKSDTMNYSTQQQLKMLLDRLSLEPMLFGRGEPSPTVFPTSEGEDEALHFGANDKGLSVLLNRLSLEPMLFGRGDYSPAAFLGKAEQKLSEQSSADAHYDDEAMVQSLSLCPMLSLDWQQTTSNTDGSDVMNKLQAVTYTEYFSDFSLSQHLLSLEPMLFGRGEMSPAAFPTSSLGQVNDSAQTVTNSDVATDLQPITGSMGSALPGSFAANQFTAEHVWVNANLEPTFS